MRRATVLLFTRDLRVHDQPALRAATADGGAVVPLFVFDDAFMDGRAGANRRAFLAEALTDLRESLRALGGDLFVRRGDLVDEALRVAHAAAADRIVVGEDASPYAQRRRRRLERACARERIELRVEDTIAAVAPGELAPADRDHYRVFTPYWRRWRETPLAAAAEPPPESRSRLGSTAATCSSVANGRRHLPTWCEAASPRPGVGWPAGSATASTTTTRRATS